MSFSVSDFTSQLTYDGARQNLFRVYMSFPTAVISDGTASAIKLSYMAKAASLPSSKMGVVTIPFMGRQVKVPGNVTYDDWVLTIINDEDFPIRNAFESWHNLINSHYGNLRDNTMVSSAGYAVNATVQQLGKTGYVLKQYDFVGLWPNDLSAIKLSWGDNDAIEEFDVTFSMQYWESTIPVAITT